MLLTKANHPETRFTTSSLNSITDPAFTVDQDFNITAFNRGAERLTGFKRWDVAGKKCYDIFRTTICKTSCALQQAKKLKEKIVSHNIALKNSKGKEIPVIVYTTPLFNEKGDFAGGVSTLRETTEKSFDQCHNSLSDSILESIADGAFAVDRHRNIISFNRTAEEITGIHRSDALGKKCYDIFKADICKSNCALKQSIDTGRDVTNLKVTIKDIEGDRIPIIITTSVLRNEKFEVIGGVETFRDISTFEKMRREISLSDTILDSIADGAFSIDHDWRITSFNKSAEDITGVHRSEAIGKKCSEIFKADICKSNCALKKSMETGLDVHDLKVNIIDIEGDKVPIRVNTCVMRNDEGQVIGGVETFRDMSAFEGLRKELTLSDCILDSINDGAFTVDKEWNITSFNLAAEKITGMPRAKAVGMKCYNVFRASICKEACALKQSIDNGEEISNLKVIIANHNGQRIPINITTSALRDEDGNVIGGVETFRDCSALEELRKEISERYSFHDIISKNHKIKNIFAILPNIAKSDSTVLIEGPSGSGKELFAKAIHTLAERPGKFIALNCAALPDTLLESELFGYRQGAFTGAKGHKLGRFALAEGGTIFLDEIGDISPALQLKLLRVLQEKEYEPLGGTTTLKADVRVIAATNKNLQEQVEAGRFREDLFFRLNVIKISLPPLAQRREDIPLLIDHFIHKFNNLKQRNIESASPEVVSLLMRHDFPGNIRELENIIEYCFVLCQGRTIEVECLPEGLLEPLQEQVMPSPTSEKATPLSNAEASTILAALQKFDGNRGKTAAHLGIDKTTLWRKMKKYQIIFPVAKKN